MLKFIFHRLIYMLITLWLIITLTFVMMKNLPGDPFGESSQKLTPENRALLMAQYGLDKPLWEQYLKYFGNLLHGDFGRSFSFPAQTVTQIIQQGFPVSLQLGVVSLCIAVIVGLALGMIAALRHNKWQDYSAMFTAIVGISIPSFVLAPLLSYYVGVEWGILPAGLWEGPQYMILPALALSLGTIAILARLMRTSMLDVLNQDFVKTAKAKGLSSSAIIWRHTVRNAILPVITILGPIFVNIITGTFVVEKVFSVPGLGTKFVESIYSNDYTMIGGLTIFYSIVLVVVLFLTDIIYGLVDPRIRLRKGG
ncbi:ABC transporter permease [Paenibacillus abyssi]|uniref:Peptide ABC transporter permease n=1 Tax=Paenibacillus abyssi TaxID=1340531 RepID=A0A917CZQ9_9BACL|nr:ABC transporter permease [Paenibacillus abyssi]GGG03672.1 peptide ABC transporter permease [Paenibacillus abyssi]